MAPLQRETLNPATVATPIGTFSNAVKVTAGSLLYIAGQVGVDSQGNLVGQGDIGAQTQQVFNNIGAILESAGGSFGNVVEFTTYVVGRELVQPYMAARTGMFQTMFPAGDYPANTLLVISGLVREDLLVEIKAVAALP